MRLLMRAWMISDMTRTLIRNATIFDGTGADPYRGDILMEDGLFRAVGPGMPADGAEVVDATGRFAIPGLIDCHVHATLFGDEGLLTYARMGVTTVKDLGGQFDAVLALRQRQRDGGAPGARALIVGTFVEGDPASWGALGSAMEVNRSEEDVDRTIERALDAGVDGIKLYAALPPALVRRAITRIAGAVPVTGHLMATKASEAVAARIGGLEHLQLTPYRDLVPPEHGFGPGDVMSDPGYWGKVRRGWEAIDPEAAAPLIAAMREAGTVMVPTLVLGARTERSFTAEEEAAFTAAQRPVLEVQRAVLATQEPPDLERSAANMLAVVRAMHAAGVPVLPGTDCGAVGVPPGYGLHIELGLMAKAMPAREVLLAATGQAARWLRRDDIGTIAAGKRADCVLLEADPMQDITNTRRIAAAYMDGERVVAA